MAPGSLTPRCRFKRCVRHLNLLPTTGYPLSGLLLHASTPCSARPNRFPPPPAFPRRPRCAWRSSGSRPRRCWHRPDRPLWRWRLSSSLRGGSSSSSSTRCSTLTPPATLQARVLELLASLGARPLGQGLEQEAGQGLAGQPSRNLCRQAAATATATATRPLACRWEAGPLRQHRGRLCSAATCRALRPSSSSSTSGLAGRAKAAGPSRGPHCMGRRQRRCRQRQA